MEERAEVVVVGGSVAGAATALHLARAGVSVMVLERARFPREKVCGEGLMPHGVAELRKLGIGNQLEEWSRPFSGIAYHVEGHTAVGRFPASEPGLGVRRFGLDRILFEACAAEPRIRVRTGVKVRKVATNDREAVVETDDGKVLARALVGADGLMSQVRAQLGLARKSTEPPRFGARMHVRLPKGRNERDVVDVYIGRRCEFYLTPTGAGEVNVAILCGKQTSRTFGGGLADGLWRLVEEHPALREYLGGSERISDAKLTGPLRHVTSGVVVDRALLVGDAAGFVDAITGEGMSLALVSARLAADTLVDALRRDALRATDLRRYERERTAFAQDLVRLAELVVWWLGKPRLARWVVRNLARHPDTFERILAVNTGRQPLSSIGPRDWARIATGL
jgi:geranylgeranyl reductase family protein